MSRRATTLGSLSWFARHELLLAWRDWMALFSGGKSVRERAVVIGGGVFIAGLHLLAYALLKAPLAMTDFGSKPALVLITGSLLLTFSMLLSQAIEQVTRAFYARADLDLILSSPASAARLFAVRISAIAITGAAMSALMMGPFINMAAYIGGANWLAVYPALAALSMLATALAVGITVVLFHAVGPKRTRLIAQIIAAVAGAALLIGLQAGAILMNGTLSRYTVLQSSGFIAAMPDPASAVWTAARAVTGDSAALAWLTLLCAAALALTIAIFAPQFGHHAVTAADAEGSDETLNRQRNFTTRSAAAALRHKEWTLLRRDAWLVSQTLMQVLYLLPPALLLWRDMGSNQHVDVVLGPVLVMAFGQLAGGLAWLALSGEDAPDLVATAPVKASALMRAKIEAVLAVIAMTAAPLIAGLALVSPWGAASAFVCIAAASAAAVTIQTWFKSTAKRTMFRRRQVATKGATFAEAFSSVFWAAAAGFAAAQSWAALAFVAFALLSLAGAYSIRPSAREHA